MANIQRTQSCPPTFLGVGSHEFFFGMQEEEEEEVYISAGEFPFANTPGSGSHMSSGGVALDSLSLSESPSHNTHPSPSGESDSQSPSHFLVVDSNIPSSPVVAQTESTGQPAAQHSPPYVYPFIVSTPPLPRHNSMNPSFETAPGATFYSSGMSAQGENDGDETDPGNGPIANIPSGILVSRLGTANWTGFHESQPGLNPEASVYQGYGSTASGSAPFIANMGQASQNTEHNGRWLMSN